VASPGPQHARKPTTGLGTRSGDDTSSLTRLDDRSAVSGQVDVMPQAGWQAMALNGALLQCSQTEILLQTSGVDSSSQKSNVHINMSEKCGPLSWPERSPEN
jgi:hypothetical protein